MQVEAETLDDLMRDVLVKVRDTGVQTHPSRNPAREIFGALLQINNPRARLSRTEQRGTLFSALGEFLWYLSKSNRLDFIEYYIAIYRDDSADQMTIHGGYGPRLFAMRGCDQVDSVVRLLRQNPESRRAVIQILNAEDVATRHKEIPCTCTLQFVLRERKLHMMVSMRSNDVYLGLPHDVFAFTMLQEVMAAMLGADVGTYKHSVGSLHLYNRDIDKVDTFLAEGWQDLDAVMPPMPSGDPWPAIDVVLAAERELREHRPIGLATLNLSSYWGDLVKLLQAYRAIKDRDIPRLSELRTEIMTPSFRPYIDKKISELAARM